MTKTSKLLAAFCVLLILWALFSAHRDNQLRAVMAEKDKADQSTITSLKADQAKIDQAHAEAIAQLQSIKQKTITVTQIVTKFRDVAPTVPDAPVVVTKKQADAIAAANVDLPDAPKIAAGDICFSQADAKPLFDAQVDAKQCAADLVQAKQDLTDQVKIGVAQTDQIKQRDLVIKGGTKWARFRSTAKWTGIGIAIGAVAVGILTHK